MHVIKEEFVFMNRWIPKRENLRARRDARFCLALWERSRYLGVKKAYMKLNFQKRVCCQVGKFMSYWSCVYVCGRGRTLPRGSATLRVFTNLTGNPALAPV